MLPKASKYTFLLILLFFSENNSVETEPEPESESESEFKSANRTGCCLPLPGLPPAGILIFPGSYENWGKEISVQYIWIAVPKNRDQVVELANYAKEHGWKIRPSGNSHNWSPITVTPDCACKVILVQTIHFNSMQIQHPNGDNPLPSIRVECGAWMEHILQHLEDHGYGLTSYPAPGDLTIGGVCAIGGHGAAIPADGEDPIPGQCYGSVSNLITSFTAIVWDDSENAYVLKTFSRSDSDANAFLVHLGRCFIIEFVLRVTKNYYLRCESRTDIDVKDLFRNPESVTSSNREKTFSYFLDECGRVEAILFPYTDKPWIKTWTVTSKQPMTSRCVTHPYNYPLTDNFPQQLSDLAKEIVNGNWVKAPDFGQAMYAAACTQVALASDLWGWSKNVLLYIKPTTLRITATGFSILTTRENIQRNLFEFYTFFKKLLDEYAARNEYPVNGPLEVRVSGLDYASNCGVDGAESPILSSMNSEQVHGCPYDAVIWLNILHFPDTPCMNLFAYEMETWLLSKYSDGNGCYGLYRPEWTKGWAYTQNNGWANPDVLYTGIPRNYPSWTKATSIFYKYDPHFVFSNCFLDNFLAHPDPTN